MCLVVGVPISWVALGDAMLRFVCFPIFFEPHKIVKLRALQKGVMGPLIADGREWFFPIVVARIDFNGVVELEDDLEQTMELFLGTTPLRPRAPDAPHEERVTGDEFTIIDEETDRIEIVARREQDLDGHFADLQLMAMVELDIRFDSGVFICRELDITSVEDVIASHVIVVGVGVENVGDFEPERLHTGCQFGSLVAGVDHSTQPTLFIANQIAKIAISSSINLLKNHCDLLQ
jgi:hypothetical protein